MKSVMEMPVMQVRSPARHTRSVLAPRHAAVGNPLDSVAGSSDTQEGEGSRQITPSPKSWKIQKSLSWLNCTYEWPAKPARTTKDEGEVSKVCRGKTSRSHAQPASTLTPRAPLLLLSFSPRPPSPPPLSSWNLFTRAGRPSAWRLPVGALCTPHPQHGPLGSRVPRRVPGLRGVRLLLYRGG